jgi:hypothetical protein
MLEFWNVKGKKQKLKQNIKYPLLETSKDCYIKNSNLVVCVFCLARNCKLVFKCNLILLIGHKNGAW